GDSDVTASDLSVFDESSGDILRGIDCNGETYALSRQNDGGIDAYYISMRSDQRTSRIARIESRVGLNDTVDQSTGVRSQRTSERAYYARSDRALKSVRIADGYSELAYAHCLRIAEGRRSKTGRIDSKNGKIGVRIVSDRIGMKAPTVRKNDFDLGSFVNYM